VAVFGDYVLTIVEAYQIAVEVVLLKSCDQVGVVGLLLSLSAIILRLHRNNWLALKRWNMWLLVRNGLLIQLY